MTESGGTRHRRTRAEMAGLGDAIYVVANELIEDPGGWADIEAAKRSERELFQRLRDGDTSAWEVDE